MIVVGKPRRKEPVVIASVVHAARVEAAQTALDVQTLQRPVAVDDPVAVGARRPLEMPGQEVVCGEL